MFALLISTDQKKIDFFKNTLESSYKLICLSHYKEAPEWIKQTSISFIILDHIDEPLHPICSLFKRTMRPNYIPILLITTSIKKNFIVNALHSGVADFLHEPLDPLEVHERIAVCLKSSQIHQKMQSMARKIRNFPFFLRKDTSFQERILIRDQTLKIISATKKDSIPLSILMIHLDSLQKLELLLGEKSLQELSELLGKFLNKNLRTYDTLLTEGIGQYLILLPKTSSNASKVIAEELRNQISTTSFKTAVKEVLVTISIGIVSFEKELSNSAKEFEQFDLCLDRVKSSLAKSQESGNLFIVNNNFTSK